MLEVDLTKSAETLLQKLYSAHVQRMDDGADYDRAVYFGSAKSINKAFVPDWKISAVIAACWTLYDAGMLDFLPLDGQPDEIVLTDRAIIYGEQAGDRKKEKARDTISWLRGLLPF